MLKVKTKGIFVIKDLTTIENINKKEEINIKGTTIHYIFSSGNIAHFLYDSFFHLMHLFETCKKNNIQINNLVLYINSYSNDKQDELIKVNFDKECINKTGDYLYSSHYWCMSVLLSYIDDLNINLIIQKMMNEVYQEACELL